VVTDYPENLDRVKQILDEIDKRPQQILLEAVICRAALNEDNAFGIDFTVLGGVDFNGVNATGSNPTDAINGNIINNLTPAPSWTTATAAPRPGSPTTSPTAACASASSTTTLGLPQGPGADDDTTILATRRS
jgi:type II secretory pathway component GspD/PulD (secretin)